MSSDYPAPKSMVAPGPPTHTIDQVYLEWSRITSVRTHRERVGEAAICDLLNALGRARGQAAADFEAFRTEVQGLTISQLDYRGGLPWVLQRAREILLEDRFESAAKMARLQLGVLR